MVEQKKASVALTVNLDGERFWSGMFEGTEKRPKTLSMGRYGIKRGLDRVLEVLGRFDMKATFFVPGMIGADHPEAIEKIMSGGHEIGFHGHTHRPMHTLTFSEQEEEFALGTEILEQRTGIRPVGFRAPEGEFTRETLELAVKYGYWYSSSLYDGDMPYVHHMAAGDLTEIPINWNTHDFPYFAFNYGPAFPSGQSRVAAYQRVEENYIEEFEAYQFYGLTYVPQFTPQSIGSPGKIQIMAHLLEKIDSCREHIRIGTCRELMENQA